MNTEQFIWRSARYGDVDVKYVAKNIFLFFSEVHIFLFLFLCFLHQWSVFTLFWVPLVVGGKQRFKPRVSKCGCWLARAMAKYLPRCFLDIQIDGQAGQWPINRLKVQLIWDIRMLYCILCGPWIVFCVAGRIIVELFSDMCPKTCDNFRCLCTGMTECFFLEIGTHT